MLSLPRFSSFGMSSSRITCAFLEGSSLELSGHDTGNIMEQDLADSLLNRDGLHHIIFPL